VHGVCPTAAEVYSLQKNKSLNKMGFSFRARSHEKRSAIMGRILVRNERDPFMAESNGKSFP
jgi:hypothetical protein